MNNKKTDLNLFRVLDAIYTHGSTTQAAKALSLSQPAVSHALARLREQFDDPLFVRRGPRMAPTAHTTTIMPDVQRALATLHGTLQTSNEFEPEHAEREFKIGFRDVLESICFPPLLESLTAPGLRFSSLSMRREQISRELATGAVDLAVDALHAVDSEIEQEKICDEPLAVVGRLGHPALANWPDLDAYLAARHVLVTLKPGPEYVDFLLQKQSHQRHIVLRCQHYFAACQVAAATDLLQTMPRSYAQVIARQMPLQVKPLPFDAPALDIRMFWHRRSSNEPANQWLRKTVAETIKRSLDLIQSEHNPPS